MTYPNKNETFIKTTQNPFHPKMSIKLIKKSQSAISTCKLCICNNQLSNYQCNFLIVNQPVRKKLPTNDKYNLSNDY